MGAVGGVKEGTMLFIYRYSRARGVSRGAWHVGMTLPCDGCRGCGVRVWDMVAARGGRRGGFCIHATEATSLVSGAM